MRWAQHSETVRDTCNKQSRECSVDPSSRSSIQLSKEEQHEREGSVLEEVCMRTHGTLNLFVVCGLACIQNTGAKTLVPYVSRQVRVVAGEKSRVDKRGLYRSARLQQYGKCNVRARAQREAWSRCVVGVLKRGCGGRPAVYIRHCCHLARARELARHPCGYHGDYDTFT